MKRLIEMESAMCKSVGEAAELKNKYKADCVPSEDELKKFRKRVEDIEFILVRILKYLFPDVSSVTFNRDYGHW